MKRKSLFPLLILVLLLSIVPVCLLIWGFWLPPQYDQTFLGEMKDKYTRLQETEGKRIVVIGGSGTAFALRSDLMEAELPDYSVVNFGMYASLGTKVMLDLSRDWIRSEDIVIIMPEQDPQTLSLYFNAEPMWQASDGCFEMLSSLNEAEMTAMAGSYPKFAASKFEYWINDAAPQPEGVYKESSFNSYGDIDYDGRFQNVMPNGWDSNTSIRLERACVEDSFIDYLNDYAVELTDCGAKVYYYFCPMNALAVVDSSEKTVAEYYDWLGSQLRFPILGNPERSIMDAEWFYDTNFHLNSSGAVVYTRQLVRDVKLLLRDTSRTNIAVPPKPEFAQQMLQSGDNSDADCFTWAPEGDHILLTGLTDEGKKADTLIIPVSYGDLPVTGFSPDLFRDNEVIRQITVQANIRSIPDSTFSGCTKLERLILLAEKPQDIIVGDGLLEGTDAELYVPEELLADYKTNYFWQGYASRIQGIPKADEDTVKTD